MQRLVSTFLSRGPSKMFARPVYSFSSDPFEERGRAKENEYFMKKNKQKMKELLAKIQDELHDEVDVDVMLEDRDYLVRKLGRFDIKNEALVKELLKWKYEE